LVQAAVGVVGRRIVRRGEGLRGIRIVRYEEYGWLKKSNIQTVVDIGANEGQFARLAAELFPAARILSFEPLPDVYERLVRSMRGHPRFDAYRYALSDENGVATIYRNKFSPSSSLRPMSAIHRELFPHTRESWREQIDVRRLDDLLSGIDLQDNILVKIDVQGYEDRVIAGAMRVIGRASLVVVETGLVELYLGGSAFAGTVEALRKGGLEFAGFLQQICAPDGRPVEGDAVFVRDWAGREYREADGSGGV